MVSSALTDIQGASRWFNQGWVTYSNEAKMTQLGVDESLFALEEGAAGAVSSEMAAAMAVGAAKISGAEMSISVTGIAGPTGATETKEVGLVWVGISINGEVTTKSAEFGHGDRHSNKEAFATFALRVALEVWGDHFETEEENSEEEVEEEIVSSSPDIPQALEILNDGPKSEDWQGDVAWSNGEEEPEEPKNESENILDSAISWGDEQISSISQNRPPNFRGAYRNCLERPRLRVRVWRTGVGVPSQ